MKYIIGNLILFCIFISQTKADYIELYNDFYPITYSSCPIGELCDYGNDDEPYIDSNGQYINTNGMAISDVSPSSGRLIIILNLGKQTYNIQSQTNCLVPTAANYVSAQVNKALNIIQNVEDVILNQSQLTLLCINSNNTGLNSSNSSYYDYYDYQDIMNPDDLLSCLKNITDNLIVEYNSAIGLLDNICVAASNKMINNILIIIGLIFIINLV